jgi:hypothetical protein
MVMIARWLAIATLCAGAVVHAEPSALDDVRLSGVSRELRAVVDRASVNGLPTELLLDKVREGLAKGVPAARIATVVRGLGESLGHARVEAQPYVSSPSPSLLKAIVEAHAAGAGTAEVVSILRATGQERERALQVLTDLAQRGYPVALATRTIAAITGHRRNGLVRLVGEAERLRSIHAATPGDALDALARAEAQGLGLDHAEQLLHRSDVGGDDPHGPSHETSGSRGPRSDRARP